MPSSVFITGAGRGLGLEFVKQLASAPDWVDIIFAAARSLNEPLKEIIKDHPNVHFIQLDVTDEAGIKRAAEEVGKGLGPNRGLNYLINNSGIGTMKTLDNVEAADMNGVFSVNVVGPTIITKEFSPLLKKAVELKGSSLIVNIGSSVGSLSITDASFAFVYRMSKSALHMLTLCTNIHHKANGIQAMSLHPGWVQTEMGGAKANLTTPDSVKQCLTVVRGFKPEYEGRLVNFEGKILPW